MEAKQFGNWLVNYRKMRGWTRKYIADQLEVPVETFRRWERGESVPKPHFQKLIREKMMVTGLPIGDK